jgi:hypothetical protein
MDADPVLWDTILWTVICCIEAGLMALFAAMLRGRDAHPARRSSVLQSAA